MRKFVIPEIFFKKIAEKGKLYSRIWFYWLSEFADEIFESDFSEKQSENLSKYITKSEISEIYESGIQLLRQDFKIIEEKKTKPKITKEQTITAEKILDYLNETANTTFTKRASNIEHIVARLKEGFLVDDFYRVIDKKVKDWRGTDWQKYLRPITLFSKTKFESYLNEQNDKHTKNNFSKFAESVAKAQSITFRSE